MRVTNHPREDDQQQKNHPSGEQPQLEGTITPRRDSPQPAPRASIALGWPPATAAAGWTRERHVTRQEALYNFLSTFSGTHFVTPRAYQVQLGVSF